MTRLKRNNAQMEISGVTIFGIILAVAYGVIFSFVYPLTPISASLVALFAILGLATSFGIWAAFKRKPKSK